MTASTSGCSAPSQVFTISGSDRPASWSKYSCADIGRPCSANRWMKISHSTGSSSESVPLKSNTTAATDTGLVLALHVCHQLLELRPVELLDGPLVLLHRPAPEVEVEVGDSVLDRAPERPAVLRHQAPQPCARDLVAQRPAPVGGDELLELLEREVRLAPDVAELERRLVVAGVLVVDEPHLATDVDEVLREEIVVARHRLFRLHAHRTVELADLRLESLVAVGEPEATLAHDGEIARLDLEHVEVVQEAPAGMEAAARARNGPEAVAAAKLPRVHHLALEEAEDESVVLRNSGDERSADAGLGGRDRVVHLVLPVDREQARVLARDPDDVAPRRARDLVVRVREAARERLHQLCVVQLRNRG